MTKLPEPAQKEDPFFAAAAADVLLLPAYLIVFAIIGGMASDMHPRETGMERMAWWVSVGIFCGWCHKLKNRLDRLIEQGNRRDEP